VGGRFRQRAQLLIEQAGNQIDYMALHWYVDNHADDFAAFMTVSELIEERLASYEGLIRALRYDNAIKRPIHIAVDEWNVWYRTHPVFGNELNNLEEIYNLEDALVVGMHLNAFIRHARTVQMANIAQIVNVIAPIFTNPQGLFLQTIFYPFELYSRTCGQTALDVAWRGDTFSAARNTGVRVLDVSATLDSSASRSRCTSSTAAQPARWKRPSRSPRGGSPARRRSRSSTGRISRRKTPSPRLTRWESASTRSRRTALN